MSFFIPYNSSSVIEYFTNLFSLNLTELSSYETLIITFLANIYFLLFWGFIIYFALKIFNRIWEKIF